MVVVVRSGWVAAGGGGVGGVGGNLPTKSPRALSPLPPCTNVGTKVVRVHLFIAGLVGSFARTITAPSPARTSPSSPSERLAAPCGAQQRNMAMAHARTQCGS